MTNFRFLQTSFIAVALFVAALTLNSCSSDPVEIPRATAEYDAKSIVEWNDKFLELERYAAGYRPGPAPRALGYIGLACYEACLPGMPTYKSVAAGMGAKVPEAQAGAAYHYPTVVNATYGYMMRQYFTVITSMTAAQLAGITNLSDKLNAQYKGEVDQATFERSKNYGEAVAKAIYEWSKTDAIGHDHHLDPFKDGIGKYKQSSAPGSWVQTIPGPVKPMFPDWGYARAFAIKDADKLCKKPIPYSENKSSQFYAQALEVKNTVESAAYDQRWLGFFWSDDLVNLTFSPGPRWTAIENQALLITDANLEKAVYANAKVGMALNDAAVACWYSKYTYNLERPESYIKRVMDPTFEPALYNPLSTDKGVTPGFPAYPSGHSTMGAAAAEVLTDLFGSSFAMSDYCHQGRPDFEGSDARAFGSFYQMAEENAYSRIPLGVHYRMDCEEGVQLGYRCGRKVNQLDWRK